MTDLLGRFAGNIPHGRLDFVDRCAQSCVRHPGSDSYYDFSRITVSPAQFLEFIESHYGPYGGGEWKRGPAGGAGWVVDVVDLDRSIFVAREGAGAEGAQVPAKGGRDA